MQHEQYIRHAVPDIDDHHCPDPDPAEILLKAKTLICREYDGKPPIDRCSEEDTIAQALQPFMANDRRSELYEIRLDLLRN